MEGSMDLDDIDEELGIGLESDNSETIGGFIIDILGEIPDDDDIGKVVEFENYRFIGDSVKDRRIDQITKICIRDSAIVEILDENGLIKNKTCAKIHARIGGYDTLQANSYMFSRSMTLPEMMEAVNTGDFDYLSKQKFTIIEGSTIPQAAEADVYKRQALYAASLPRESWIPWIHSWIHHGTS